MTLRVVFRRAARAELMLLRYGTKIGRPAWGRSCVGDHRVVDLYRITPSVFPPNTSKFDVRRHGAFRTQCLFVRGESRCRPGGVSRTDGTRLSADARVTIRAARKTYRTMRRGPGMSKPRAPSLAMDDAFRAGTSYKLKHLFHATMRGIGRRDGTVTLSVYA